eukprot:CAMPEP_0180630966 /NCGR_PEP_ID=MMETSP1037_2-20121125/40278_1 /TAXON_ID=632150 /ORGANISM="Azadinium spinosum, Strain 3D9" /LENGTH=145 /DNA_ID=CAMNT_0022651873 /DNA_START=390 /DNA_END=828 /DNA_ORIENTATION=+
MRMEIPKMWPTSAKADKSLPLPSALGPTSSGIERPTKTMKTKEITVCTMCSTGDSNAPRHAQPPETEHLCLQRSTDPFLTSPHLGQLRPQAAAPATRLALELPRLLFFDHVLGVIFVTGNIGEENSTRALPHGTRHTLLDEHLQG